MKYRAEIDGLRAFAIIPVVLFHAGGGGGGGLFSGGFVGVDVFFVISGYLITSIIYDEISSNQFSLLNFYERRARRIIPALTIVIIFTSAASWVVMNQFELNKFGNALIGVATFSSNIVFWMTQGYFTETSELNPLLHTWSLGVEEQFYLLFPLLMMLIPIAKKRILLILLTASIFLSLMVSIWAVNMRMTATISSGAFFLLPTRAWELGIGSFVAIMHYHKSMSAPQFMILTKVQLQNFLSLLGVGLILSAIFFIKSSTPFPGLASIAPVLGSSLIIAFATNDTIVGRILSLNFLVKIGLVSYSLYLWHQPLFALYRIKTGTLEVSLTTQTIIILGAVFLAYLTWRFVEQPFRKRKFLNCPTILSLTVIVCLFFGFIAYSSKHVSKGHEYRLAETLSKNDYVYFENLDERKLNEGRLYHPLPNIEAIAIGSSRIMKLSSETIGKSMFNFAVSGASIEDYVAFIPEAVLKTNPTTVFLGADPWLFNSKNFKDDWRSSSDLYQYSRQRLEEQTGQASLKSFFEEFDADQYSMNFFQNLFKAVNISSLAPTDGDATYKAKKFYDGYLFEQYEDILSQEAIEHHAPIVLNYSMTEFIYDSDSENQYQSLIKWLQKQGITVFIVLSPYHPSVVQLMKEERPIYFEIEKNFRELAEKLNVKILGSYDPNLVGCSKFEFYDGYHPTESCIKKVFNQEN